MSNAPISSDPECPFRKKHSDREQSLALDPHNLKYSLQREFGPHPAIGFSTLH